MNRSTSTRRGAPPVWSLLCALAVLVGGCDDSVDPTLGTDQAFTIYGALDPTADQQALRVVPIQGQIDVDPTEIDAVVTATDIASGEVTAFRDSLVTFENGTQGHVFVADWAPRPGRTYRVAARRTEDDATSFAEVRVPDAVVPTVEVGSSTNVEVVYEVRAPSAPRIRFGELTARLSGLPGAPDDTVSVVVSSFDPVRQTDGVWGRDVTFISTLRAYLRAEGYPDRSVRLVDVTYRLFVTNAEWVVPEGGFDVDEIVEPGTVSNVTGGFGYIGAGYWTEVSWVPALATQVRAGFLVSDDPASQMFINEINVDGWVELYNPTLEAVSISGYGLTDNDSGTPPSDPFPSGTVVPAKGFFVADLDISVGEGTQVFFINPTGAVVTTLFVDEPIGGELNPRSYGSYPDGRTYVPFRDGPDIFRGGIVPSRGAPNEVVYKPFVINEIYPGGDGDGWVEILVTDPRPPAGVRVGTDGPGVWSNGFPSAEADPYLRFDEITFDLPLGGGEVLVLYQYPQGGFVRVCDVRTYEPMPGGTAAGYLPDGLSGTWTTGLTPTPLAPNGGSPFALR